VTLESEGYIIKGSFFNWLNFESILLFFIGVISGLNDIPYCCKMMKRDRGGFNSAVNLMFAAKSLMTVITDKGVF